MADKSRGFVLVYGAGGAGARAGCSPSPSTGAYNACRNRLVRFTSMRFGRHRSITCEGVGCSIWRRRDWNRVGCHEILGGKLTERRIARQSKVRSSS